jgi:hypothetical protein
MTPEVLSTYFSAFDRHPRCTRWSRNDLAECAGRAQSTGYTLSSSPDTARNRPTRYTQAYAGEISSSLLPFPVILPLGPLRIICSIDYTSLVPHPPPYLYEEHRKRAGVLASPCVAELF